MLPRFIAALLVSHGDRRMRGRSQLNTTANAEGSKHRNPAPSELRAGGFEARFEIGFEARSFERKVEFHGLATQIEVERNGRVALEQSRHFVQNRVAALARYAAVIRARGRSGFLSLQLQEFIIMEHTKHMLSVPLSQLVRSSDNVRRHSAGQVEELAALIASQSLLQNLVVTEQPLMRGRKLSMRFAVAAGERRRRAMLLLQQQGRLPKDYEVLCELVPLERALEISIAENSGREPLHPADEFDAFKALIDEGKGIEDVAARFGVSVLTVQRRLKLAAVSPKLLNLYRADDGTINLDQLMALAVSDDHAAQERAWLEAQPWDRAPAALKRVLNADAVAASGNALVQFVGIEAYEAAGGVVRRDLFDDEQSRFLSDPALLQRLVTDKLDVMAAELRTEGWAWVETCSHLDPQAMRQFTPCQHDVRKPTRQERDELAALATRSTELDQQERALNDAPEWSEDEAERIELEQQCITVRRTAIHEARKIWSPDVKAHAGALVTVDREGEAAVMRGLMRDADRKAVAAAIKVADEAEGQGLEVVEAATKKHPAACSQSLVKRLAAHRTAALQVVLSRNTPVALVALTHVFVTRVFGEDHRRAASALQIAPQLSAYAVDAAADDIKDSLAWRALDAAKQEWMARLPEQQGEWFAWLLAVSQAELLDLLALCTALTVNALPGAGAAADADVIAEALQLDMADWWEVSPQSYLNHVPKAQIIQALDEAEPGQSHQAASALKKEALVATAAARLADKRWLPTPLRRPQG